MKFVKIENPDEKSRICERVLRSLPEWFGLEGPLLNYIREVKEMETWGALDPEAIGFISLKKHNLSSAEIYVMGVLPEYHGEQVGTQLLQIAEQALALEGFKFLTVKTLSESHPDMHYAKTRKFYSKKGFVPLEEFKTLWGKENPCLMMIKALNSGGEYSHV